MLQQSLLPASTCTRRRRGRWLWVTTLVFIANVSLRTLRQALPGCVTVHRLPRMMDPKETGQALTHTPTNSAECPLAKHKSPAKKKPRWPTKKPAPVTRRPTGPVQHPCPSVAMSSGDAIAVPKRATSRRPCRAARPVEDEVVGDVHEPGKSATGLQKLSRKRTCGNITCTKKHLMKTVFHLGTLGA